MTQPQPPEGSPAARAQVKPLPLLRPKIGDTDTFEWGDSFSYSRRKTFKVCQRQAALNYALNISPKGVVSQPLRMGSGFALCLEEQDPKAHKELYEGYVAQANDLDQERLMVMEAIAITEMARGYFVRYGYDEARELYFEQPIAGSRLLDRGYADFANGSLKTDGDKLIFGCLGEDKFRGRFTSDQAKWLQTDEQATSMFSLALREGHPVNRMEYRVTLRPYMHKTKTPDEYRRWLQDKLASAKGGSFFISATVTRTAAQIAAHERRIEALAQELEAAEKAGEWPQNFDACMQYNRLCDYFEVCRRGIIPPDLYEVRPEHDRSSDRRDDTSGAPEAQ